MKKIDRLILSSFIPPYLMAFLTVEFVLVMQFLWKHLDEVIGKGISLGVILELIFYFSVKIIPEAVPVTILISSVMVFGNLAEKYELSSMKSAGLSLTRIMAGGFILAIMTSMLSLVASNYLKPRANHKFFQRLFSIKKQDLTLNIEEGVFSYDFKNFTIRVGKKDQDGQGISDIIIYDNSGTDKKKINMLIAEDGRMYSKSGTNQFVMDLGLGEQYRELTSARKDKNQHEFVRTKFKSWSKVFDLSEFDFEAENFNSSRREYDLLNALQLKASIDSFSYKIETTIQENRYDYGQLLEVSAIDTDAESKQISKDDEEKLPEKLSSAIAEKDKQVKANKNKTKLKDPAIQELSLKIESVNNLLDYFQYTETGKLSKRMKYLVDKKSNTITKNKNDNIVLSKTKNRYVLRLHQMFSWALICTVFLFIGAPLGSIIKKGGYGYPLLTAILFFMLFIILNIMGDRLTASGEIHPIFGAWIANLVLVPVAIFTTYKALQDSSFSGIKDMWLFRKIGGWITKRQA